MPRPFEVERARIDWEDELTPLASRFGDTYFSRGQGLQESAYIFIEQNRIAERAREKRTLTVAELGFGTGLNFLLTWKSWRENRTADSILDYVACEQFPLTRIDLERSVAHWPELAELSSQLLSSYQTLLPGYVRYLFDEGRVALTLLIGDARLLLSELDTPVDAWYLDGFAPAKNPELWESGIFSHMSRLSHPKTSFASFTAASHVRHALGAAGFSVEKIPGHGRKRESIRGTFVAIPGNHSLLPPWKAFPPSGSETARDIVVLGGGLAGFGAAAALCARGHSVTILEASTKGFGGASGNPAGIFTPYIAREMTRTTALYLTSFLFSLDRIRQFEQTLGTELLHRTGATQTIYTKRLEQLVQSFDQLGLDSQIACLEQNDSGTSIVFPQAGWISAPGLCSAIAEIFRDRLTVHCGHCASLLIRSGNRWRVETENGAAFEASVVVVASAQHSSRFSQTSWIPLEAIRGEIIQAQATSTSQELKTILMGLGYVLPAENNRHLIGATYVHHRFDSDPDPADQARLLEQAQQLLPALRESHICQSRVSFRTSTHNRLPYIGPVVIKESFQQIFHDLKKGYAPKHYPAPDYHPSLYISAGHGSRGLVSTLAAGELLANYIDGTTPLFPVTLRGELNPAGFLARTLTQH